MAWFQETYIAILFISILKTSYEIDLKLVKVNIDKCLQQKKCHVVSVYLMGSWMLFYLFYEMLYGKPSQNKDVVLLVLEFPLWRHDNLMIISTMGFNLPARLQHSTKMVWYNEYRYEMIWMRVRSHCRGVKDIEHKWYFELTKDTPLVCSEKLILLYTQVLHWDDFIYSLLVRNVIFKLVYDIECNISIVADCFPIPWDLLEELSLELQPNWQSYYGNGCKCMLPKCFLILGRRYGSGKTRN